MCIFFLLLYFCEYAVGSGDCQPFQAILVDDSFVENSRDFAYNEIVVVTNPKSHVIQAFLSRTSNAVICEACDVHDAFVAAASAIRANYNTVHQFSFSSVCSQLSFNGDCVPRVVRSQCPTKLLPLLCPVSVNSLRNCQRIQSESGIVVSPTGRVMSLPNDFSCPVLSIYRGVGSIPVRMLLELHVGQPIAIRSFFRADRNDAFMRHQYDPPAGRGAVVVYSSPILQAYSLCGGNDAERTVACINVESLAYAQYALAALLQVQLGQRIVRFENWLSDDFLRSIVSSIPERCLFLPGEFDAGLAQLARDYLLQSSSGTLRARAAGDPEEETFLRGMQNASNPDRLEFEAVYGSTVLNVFLDKWKGNFNILAKWFPEIDTSAVYAKLAPEPPQILQSKQNDVHVLLPTKNPSDLDSCIESLVSNANFAFGGVHFHFGVDWGDKSTVASIRKSFVARPNVLYRIHHIFNRASDISTIVNHLFAVNTNGRYFLRFNDDSRMRTRNWNELAIRALRVEPVDVGIALMRDLRHESLQTHSFVSHMHKQFFGGLYFPLHFRNLFEDDWITAAYPRAWRRPTSIEIEHRFEKLRYEMHRTTPEAFDKIMTETNFMVEDAIRRLNLTLPA